MHRISVIIPARDAARVLPRTLAAACAQSDDVVVVDNGSRDATAEVARAHGARVVTEPRAGRARARNAGVAAAEAELLVFLDADCVPDPGWLEAHSRCLESAALSGGPVLLETSAAPNAVERFDVAWRLRQEHTIREQRWAGTGNLGVHRVLFDRLGGLDERWTHAAEDVDFCLRAAELDEPIAFCPEAVVRHPASTGLRPVLARAARQGYGSTQLHHRYAGAIGRRDWRHPKPMLAGDWALRRFDLEDRRDLRWLARADYAGRVAGSLWAELRRAR